MLVVGDTAAGCVRYVDARGFHAIFAGTIKLTFSLAIFDTDGLVRDGAAVVGTCNVREDGDGGDKQGDRHD
jgi:hypothetical protein